jgi:hypothetical protein
VKRIIGSGFILGLVLALVFGLFGCTGGQTRKGGEVTDKESTQKESPSRKIASKSKEDGARFKEFRVDYPAPGEDWNGPLNFSLKVSIVDKKSAQLFVRPGWVIKSAEEIQNAKERNLASENWLTSLDTKDLHGQLSELAIVTKAEDKLGAEGCLYPIRIQFLMEDGESIEHEGCRSDMPWGRAVSQQVSTWLSAASQSREERL